MILSELKPQIGFNGLSVMYHVARVLASGSGLQEIMGQVLEILEIHAGMNRGVISILSADGKELVADVARGISATERLKGRYRLGEGITGRVVESGKPILVPILGDEPTFLDKTGARSQINSGNVAFLCVPISVGEKTIGTLSVDRLTTGKEDENSALEEEVRFLESIADIIAQIVKLRRSSQARIASLEKENLELRQTLEDTGRPDEMIGNSSLMRETYRQIAQVAPSPTTVLILGETGTGKELVARAIHQKSRYKDGPFVAVNCAALPESLLESALFGHEKGSFTGATEKRIGQFEAAQDGTLFLDEIAEMSPSAQSRLLRAIQEKEFQRVGGTRLIQVNVRLIVATNRNLEEDVAEGRFREDLFYRVNVFGVILPPLRERGADILLLADYFTRKYATIHHKEIKRISTPAIDMLSAYHWPGNVRELENVIERSVIVANADVIDGHDLPPTLQMKDLAQQGKRLGTLETLVAAYEKELIIDALKDSRGNQSQAARILGTTKRIIQYKIANLGIDYRRFKS